MDNITLHIFSKDRPMQLECLIRSVFENTTIFSKIYVQYSTSKQYKDGYDKLKELYPNIDFICEDGKGFGKTFRKLFNKIDGRICYMVDDDIMFGEVDDVPLCNIFSLRLGQNIKQQVHFEYTGSVDGNIFRKGIIKNVVKEPFENPNQFEIALLKNTRGYKMIHFEDSKIVGIPNNKVSDTSSCHDMGGNLRRLNALFLDGWVIDYKKMDLTCNNVHKEVLYEIKRVIFTEEKLSKN